MNIASIVQNVKLPKGLMRLKVLGQKHSPEIMIVVGAGLVIGAAVLACKNTIEAHEVLLDTDEELKKINYGEDLAVEAENVDAVKIVRDSRKARNKVYFNTGKEMARLYGPPIGIAAIGFTMIFGSHKILKDRNTALTLAYTNLLANYNNYRKSIRDRFGEEAEFEILRDGEKTDIVAVDEDGNETIIKDAEIVHDDGSGHSPYARIFDPSCRDWSTNPEANLNWLRCKQNYCNDKLRAEGILFLNDVYKELGFTRTPAGQIVGWVWDPRNEIDDTQRDNYVDFGIYDNLYKDAAKRAFINAAEPCVWLDFNVDGVVYDLI